MHRTGTVVDAVYTRAEPLKVRRYLSVDHGSNWSGWSLVKLRDRHPKDLARQLVGWCQTERCIDISKVISKEPVELRTICRVVFGSVPPAPIASLRDEQFF